MLEAGISATKFNFSNDKIKQVVLRLVNRRTAIEYRELGEGREGNFSPKNIFSLRKTVIPLS